MHQNRNELRKSEQTACMKQKLSRYFLQCHKLPKKQIQFKQHYKVECISEHSHKEKLQDQDLHSLPFLDTTTFRTTHQVFETKESLG